MVRERRRDDARRALPPVGALQLEQFLSGAEGDWVARRVPGARATKDYRCPGCNQVLARGLPHVVAWPVDHAGGVDDRRHWHTPCWAREARRLGLTPAAHDRRDGLER